MIIGLSKKRIMVKRKMNLVDAGNAFDDIILSMSTWKMHSLLVCTKCNIWYTFSGFIFCLIQTTKYLYKITLIHQFVYHLRYNNTYLKYVCYRNSTHVYIWYHKTIINTNCTGMAIIDTFLLHVIANHQHIPNQ